MLSLLLLLGNTRCGFERRIDSIAFHCFQYFRSHGGIRP